MSVETRLMTADELLAMPDDGMRHELVNGELITMSPAGTDHGEIAMRIALHLAAHVQKHRLGKVYSSDTGFKLGQDPDTVRAPDVTFISASRVVKTRKHFPGAPDLAVEVISPNDTYSEVHAKVREYLAAGTRLVIVVDLDGEVAEIHSPTGVRYIPPEGSLDGAEVVPGWTLPLRELFA